MVAAARWRCNHARPGRLDSGVAFAQALTNGEKMNNPIASNNEARLAQMLTTLLQQGGHVTGQPESVNALLEIAGRAVAAPGAAPRPLPTIDPVTNGWLAALADAFHSARREGSAHTAEKVHEILHHFARGDRLPVAFPAEVTETFDKFSHALDLIAEGHPWDDVAVETGIVFTVRAAKIAAEAAIKAAADAPQRPVIVVSLKDGMVRAVDATHPADVVFLDADISSSAVQDLTCIGDDLYRVTELAAVARQDTPGADFVLDVLAGMDASHARRAVAEAESEEQSAPRS